MSTEQNKKKEINLRNILSFIEGNTNYLMDIFGMYPDYKKEQVLWRLSLCKDDCVKEGECQYCGCPPHKKAFVDKSCNKGDRFPDMMGEEEWKEYKLKHKIDDTRF